MDAGVSHGSSDAGNERCASRNLLVNDENTRPDVLDGEAGDARRVGVKLWLSALTRSHRPVAVGWTSGQ